MRVWLSHRVLAQEGINWGSHATLSCHEQSYSKSSPNLWNLAGFLRVMGPRSTSSSQDAFSVTGSRQLFSPDVEQPKLPGLTFSLKKYALSQMWCHTPVIPVRGMPWPFPHPKTQSPARGSIPRPQLQSERLPQAGSHSRRDLKPAFSLPGKGTWKTWFLFFFLVCLKQ